MTPSEARQARRTTGPPAVKPAEPKKSSSTKRKDGPPRIRCPRCGWQPSREDRWGCTCGWIWNTFDTRGVCPNCRKQWAETQCRSCQQWSAHEGWYADGE